MESWPTSSIESWDLLFSRDDMVSMELSSSSCSEIGVSLGFRTLYQGISIVA